MRAILDTNVYSAVRHGDQSALECLARADRVCMSVVVMGEILFGAEAGSQTQRNQDDLDEFLSEPQVDVLDVTQETAAWYGRIKAALRKKGKPIPDNDAWIAAHAMEHSASVISYDEHFRYVDGLIWIKP